MRFANAQAAKRARVRERQRADVYAVSDDDMVRKLID
jgi:hypothetical protein